MTSPPNQPSSPSLLSEKEAQIRDGDIQALLEAGVSMMQLEDLYGIKNVHRVAESYITCHDNDMEMADHETRRSKLATLLFLRAPSSSLQSIMKSDDVIDAVFEALTADPDDVLLMDPLLHTPLHDPVVLSSGIVVDRTTALDPTTGELRLKKCPFRRIPLAKEVYEIYPLQEKVRQWEHQRLERCVSVAQTFMNQKDYDRANRVFAIAHGFLQEHLHQSQQQQQQQTPLNHIPPHVVIATTGAPTYRPREILLLALQLAQLERELPGVTDDIPRSVQIHQRLIQVAHSCSSDKADWQLLVVNCLEDCWKRCSMLLAFGSQAKKAFEIRHAFSPLIKYSTLMQLQLLDELQKLCHLDLTLAKHVEDEPSIWNCRRVLLKLLDEPERTGFMETEHITGNEEELYYHLPYDASLWPQEKFTDPALGLIHFGNTNTSNNNNPAAPPIHTQGLPCKVNLNPHSAGGDHWIEVAFRADNIQSPGHLNSIFSQHSSAAGWEIRLAVRPRSQFIFPNLFHVVSDPANEPIDNGGIHVEAVWTTVSPTLGNIQHNEFANSNVNLQIGTWYHVVLAYQHATSTLSLYVNGQVQRRQVSGDFVPAKKGLPRLGQSLGWPEDRRFQGWIAFGGGGYELPEPTVAALDEHVKKLAQARLSKLPKQPAQHQPPPPKPEVSASEEEEEEEEEYSIGIGESSSGVEYSSGFDDSASEAGDEEED